MKKQQAQNLLQKDIKTMNLEELQNYKVKVIDAWRESKAEYGFDKAIEDGFYVSIASESASGYKPKDIWLTQNLETRLDEITVYEKELYKEKRKTVSRKYER